MRERVVRFGRDSALAGILTEPSADGAGDRRPPVLMLSAGTLHRVGACRLHVKLARRLAVQGFRSLRFDFSGIGDSPPRFDALPFERTSVLETQDAMDYLSRVTGAREFVPLGLCSGADAAFFTAQADPRVVGLVQLDAFAYRTPRFYWHHYAPRLLRLDVWLRFLGHPREALRMLRGRRAESPAAAAATDPDEPVYARHLPPKSEVERSLRALAARTVQQLYIYTGGLAHDYNHARQFEDCYRSVDFRGTLQVRYLPEADHIITDLGQQRLVVDLVCDWFGRRWP